MQTPLHPSITVISPTWFRIDPEGTHLNSVANKEYVDWVNEQGVFVWASVLDVWYSNNRLMLTDRNSRQNVINQLVDFIGLFNLNGINIDFSYTNEAEFSHKIQFLRELAIQMRQRGIVLSAAVKAPMDKTEHNNYNLIGKIVDFVIVKTFDEHEQNPQDAGANASLPFVKSGVEKMLLEVPCDRLIMGLQFNNIIWKTVPSIDKVEVYKSMRTDTTRSFFEGHSGVWEWDESVGSYRGEAPAFYEGESVVFRVWIEEERSIKEKMQIYNDNNLAGVAGWYRVLAINEFWDVIGEYFSKGD
jgi:spore germination protein YaaH